MGSFSYISLAGFLFMRRVSLTHPVLTLTRGSFSSHPILLSCLSGECLLPIPCWLCFCLGSFFYTSHTSFIFIWEDSLSHPVLASFLSVEFLLHIPCWLHFDAESFSFTSRTDFVFMWGVSVTHPMLTLFLCGEFLLHTRAVLIFMEGISLTHTILASFLFCFVLF